MSLAEPTVRRWTREEYYQMADLGFFDDQRVELIDGEIIAMAPQKDVHAAVTGLVGRALNRTFGAGCWVRYQLPLHLGQASEPEPDVSVVSGTERDYIGTGHPKTALLIVEVSETTLRFDRTRKASLYASVGIGDYWIVNLIDRVLEVYRQPMPDSAEPHGFRYAQSLTLKAGQTIAPLAKPQASIAVADLLP